MTCVAARSQFGLYLAPMRIASLRICADMIRGNAQQRTHIVPQRVLEPAQHKNNSLENRPKLDRRGLLCRLRLGDRCRCGGRL